MGRGPSREHTLGARPHAQGTKNDLQVSCRSPAQGQLRRTLGVTRQTEGTEAERHGVCSRMAGSQERTCVLTRWPAQVREGHVFRAKPTSTQGSPALAHVTAAHCSGPPRVLLGGDSRWCCRG